MYDEALSQYITETFAAEDEALRRVREMIPQKGLPAIAVSPEEGRFLQWLVRAIGARLAVEIGALGGYSGSWIARGLLPGGKLITIEKNAQHAAVAREHFALTAVADRVELKLGDARQVLPKLRGPMDFVFIDAEKEDNPFYLEWAAGALRPGGVAAAHNAFRGGRVLTPDNPDGEITRAFNRSLAGDPRWLATIFPAGDGMAIAVRL
jgi:caffeoyl-CoA O-methyltransferase